MPGNITVQKIIAILLHRIVFILAAGAVMGLIFFGYTSLFITPMYSTSSMIFVQNYNKSTSKTTDDQSATSSAESSNTSNNKTAQKIFSSDISGSSSLASICVILFQNSDEITQLYDGCVVDIAVHDSSFYIDITVSGSDPQKCANVANQISEQCQTVYHNNFDYGQIGVIRTAKEPYAPYSPNKVKNTLIGVAIGLVAACVIAILLELIDTTIKSDEDLSEIYKVPVFAEIPDFES